MGHAQVGLILILRAQQRNRRVAEIDRIVESLRLARIQTHLRDLPRGLLELSLGLLQALLSDPENVHTKLIGQTFGFLRKYSHAPPLSTYPLCLRSVSSPGAKPRA